MDINLYYSIAAGRVNRIIKNYKISYCSPWINSGGFIYCQLYQDPGRRKKRTRDSQRGQGAIKNYSSVNYGAGIFLYTAIKPVARPYGVFMLC